MHRSFRLLPLTAALLVAVGATHAAPTKKPAKRAPAPNQVKGQGQMVGANGQFGQVYTLDNGFNFEVLSGRYSVEPFVAYETLAAHSDQKLVVLDLAIKNVNDGDNFFDSQDLFTLVDAQGQLYTGGTIALTSQGDKEASFTLRPGQGLGQPALHDPLRFGILVPAKARIVKIMLNHGRKGRDEKTIRYYVAGATAAEAGEAGDPKNVLAALPDGVRDPSDPSGAVALDQGKGAKGAFLPSGAYGIRFESLTYTSDPIFNGNAPDEGKKYAVLTVTAKNLTAKEQGIFDLEGGDSPLYEITDTDGASYKPVGYRKPRLDEDADHTFKPGDEYTFRIIFQVPKDVKIKTLVLGASGSRTWVFEPADLQ